MMRPSVAIAMCILIVVAACSDSGKKPGTPVSAGAKPAPTVATQATATVPQAQPAPQPEYVYNAVGRRDPFSPIVIKEGPAAKQGDRPPLERFGVTEFKLAGVVWGGYGYNAMLEGPDGKGYFVRVGTIIGPNKGVVKKITQQMMVVEEKFKTVTGDIDRKEIIVELRKKQEGIQ